MLVCCLMTKYSDWLESQLKAKGMSPAELSRASRKDQGVISRLLNGDRNPRPETIESICKALGVPVEEGYRAAGLLPKKGPHSVLEEKALYIINSMETEAYQKRALSLLEYLKQEEEKELHNAARKTPPKPSETS
jgi:transcriptional regulator with XRE-family HTH domain